MTNRRPSRYVCVVSESTILLEMPGGRAWLTSLIETLDAAVRIDDSGSTLDALTSERVAANVVSQLRPDHASALAAILLQGYIRRALIPDVV